MTGNVPVALIAGVGEGLGSAIAHRFAKAGFATVLVARSAERLERIASDIESEGGRGVAYVADISEESAVSKLFDDVEVEVGPVSVAVFNAGTFYRASILDTPASVFEQVWRSTCYAGFLMAREAARHMVPRALDGEKHTIIFTGATASLRGASEFAAFSAAKGGLRQLAQSMARELGGKGIHVASVIIDGMIDSRAVRERFTDDLAELLTEDLLQPNDVAEVYVQLHRQPRSAWTFELDLRPWSERF